MTSNVVFIIIEFSDFKYNESAIFFVKKIDFCRKNVVLFIIENYLICIVFTCYYFFEKTT